MPFNQASCFAPTLLIDVDDVMVGVTTFVSLAHGNGITFVDETSVFTFLNLFCSPLPPAEPFTPPHEADTTSTEIADADRFVEFWIAASVTVERSLTTAAFVAPLTAAAAGGTVGP